MHLSRCSAPSMTTWAGGKRAMQGLVLASDCRGLERLQGVQSWFVVSVGLSVYLLEGRALAPCRVSAPAGHGHSIREQGEKCIVF